MQARDIMTKEVITITDRTPVHEIAKLLLKHRISAVPVLNEEHSVIGMVSEGDLLRRIGDADKPRRSWWLELLSGTDSKAGDFVKTRGRYARDVMTTNVKTIGEDMPVGEIARLLEKKRIKRVPVVRDGSLVGIISRANLLQGLAAVPPVSIPTPSTSDRDLRAQVLKALAVVPGYSASLVSVSVQDGVVQIWGVANSDNEEHAIRVAAENVAGVREIEMDMGRIPSWAYGI